MNKSCHICFTCDCSQQNDTWRAL